MKFNVAQLLKSPVGTTREYDIDEDISGVIEDVPITSSVVGHVKLIYMPSAILVNADLDLSVALNCSRCLEELTYPLHVHFEEEFMPTVDIVTGVELPEPDDESEFTIDANHILDLTRAVREYSLLALPMRPLCFEECKGLCPTCGQNLNRGRCSCPTAPTDSRLSVLAKLLEQEERKE